MLSRGLLRASTRTARSGLRFASSEAMVDKIEAPVTAYTSINDDRLVGAYPDVEPEYYHHRNPHIKYDEQQNKRNTGEPIYHYYDLMDVWSPDRFDEVSDRTALKNIGLTITAFGAFSAFMYFFVSHEPPAARREYLHEGMYKALGGTEETKEMFQARVDSGN